MSRAKRVLLVSLGLTSFAIGAVGVVVPVLPTTPFLLLAAALFLHSSERWYRWLVGHRVFGRQIHSYLRYRAVDARTKAVGIAVLWAGIGLSIALVDAGWVRALLGITGLAVTIHILWLRTLTGTLKARIDAQHAGESSGGIDEQGRQEV